MSELLRELTTFASTDREAWRKDVERSLKGRLFDETLVKRTIEGLPIEPLYTRDERLADREGDVPGAPPFVRGLPAPGTSDAPRRGWTRCVEVEHPDVRRANAMVLADLEGGAERVVVRIASARQMLETSSDTLPGLVTSGRGGTWVEDTGDLETLLNGVLWSLAPVSLLAPADPACAHILFTACAQLRERGGDGLSAQIDVQRLAWQAADVSTWLHEYDDVVCAEARRGAARPFHLSDARPLWISTLDLRHAGADMVQEIAAGLGMFVAAVRALDGLGIPSAAVLRASEFRFGVGSDFFGEIAKLRAFRRCLGLVLDTLGLAGHASDVLVTASTAEETLTRRDVYVNLLRTTAEATAGILGGADALIVLPFDVRLGGGAGLGRRLARNLHSLLDEESDAGAVVDPGGGSFYLEHRTEQFAEAAWRQFVEWEQAGGFVAACATGLVRTAVDTRWQARAARLRTRRDAVLGVSVFPRLDEARPDADAFDANAFLQHWQTRLGASRRDGEGDAIVTGLDVHYLDEDFEALRSAADRIIAATGARPAIFGALVGTPASHATRLDWVRDLLAAAGLRLHAQPVDEAGDTLPAALRESGTTSAIVIAADAVFGSTVPMVVSRLHTAGVENVFVAGRPGEHDATLQHAGVAGFIHSGADVIPFLTRLLTDAEAAHARS